MADPEIIEELPPSHLGTKEHWDKVYSHELENYEDIGEEGEIWFGEESIEKIVEWTQDHLPRESVSPVSILEIGSGNGTLLFGLAEEFGSRATIHGIDYSPDAIKLAVAIGKERGGPAGDVRFDVCDFLNEDVTGSSDSWDIILDKGTLDAIALGDKDQLGRSPAHAYPTRLRRLLKPGSIFLVTSCNFTEEELTAQFVTPETGLVFHSRIQHRTFTFGGQKGNVISSVAFQQPIH